MLRRQPEAALSLSDMADITALSPSHFCRVFRSIVGIPPIEFQAALRLDLAKRLLLTTPLSVTEICFAVGYSSPGTFTSRFSRLVGLPPRTLREVAQGGGRGAGLTPQPSVPVRVGTDVAGRIDGPDAFSGLIVVGLVPSPLPQSRPVACTVLAKPGRYCISSVPDGRWHLLAVGVPGTGSDEGHLLLPPAVLVGVGNGLLVVRRGHSWGNPNVCLRPPHPLDPPVLTILPSRGAAVAG
jgi:AraC family transcriptional regulator